MKRDRRLRALSDDHHQALVLARRALTLANDDEPRARQEVWAEIVLRFGLELMPHFAIEEELVLPAIEAAGERDLAERIRVEHAELRRLVQQAPEPMKTRLSDFGAALRDHVRFEERVLFPAVQEKVSDEELEAVAGACRHSAQGRVSDAGITDPARESR